MLIGALEIKVSLIGLGPCWIYGTFENKGMRRTGIKPDIKNVGDLLIIFRLAVVAQETTRRGREPSVGTFIGEGLLDTRKHCFVVQHRARLLLDKDRQRHAPGTLARQHPI